MRKVTDMIPFKQYIKKMRDVRAKDFASVVLFLAAYPVSKIFRLRHKDLWLVCEDRMEARDNGYWFFKYVVENHKDQEIVYAIDSKSQDYQKVSGLGKVIPYGGFIHWIYYLTASKNISSQKGGKPNAAFCYFLEINGILKNCRIFLQHGITKDDMDWLYYKNTRFSMFICGAKPEYEYVAKKFGYPKEYVQYLGFSRFDNLQNVTSDHKKILVMPSWRSWFSLKSKNEDGKIEDFERSEYYIRWSQFLNDKKLDEILDRSGLTLYFYPHRNMQKFLTEFKSKSKHVVFADCQNYDVQTLLKECAVLITDFSSVFFDFIYMKKPVIFYQFDYDRFRKDQYSEGYFKYNNNQFGQAFKNRDDVIANLQRIIRSGAKVDEDFL